MKVIKSAIVYTFPNSICKFVNFINLVDFSCHISGKISLNLPSQWYGPLNKNSSNDQQARELGMQFNVSYNH